jgi:hypothetical protein
MNIHFLYYEYKKWMCYIDGQKNKYSMAIIYYMLGFISGLLKRARCELNRIRYDTDCRQWIIYNRAVVAVSHIVHTGPGIVLVVC